MTQINTNIVGRLQATLGQATGGGIEMPQLLLPVVEMILPTGLVGFNSTVNLEKKNASFTLNSFQSQAASSAAFAVVLATLDRGLYRIRGTLRSMNLGGPAPTVGNERAVQLVLMDEPGIQLFPLGLTMLQASVPQADRFEYVFHLSKARFQIAMLSFNATGVGETLSASASVSIESFV